MFHNIHATLKSCAWGLVLVCLTMQPLPEDVSSRAIRMRRNLQGLLHDSLHGRWWPWLENYYSPAMQVTSDINAEVESQNRHLDNLVRACLPFPALYSHARLCLWKASLCFRQCQALLLATFDEQRTAIALLCDIWRKGLRSIV